MRESELGREIQGNLALALAGATADDPATMSEERSPKHEQSRRSLPDDLKPVFDALVQDYKFAAHVHYRTVLVSYNILADLVRAGWRLAAKPLPTNAEAFPT